MSEHQDVPEQPGKLGRQRDEATLVADAVRGDERAFRELVAGHAERTHRSILRLVVDANVADDVMQEVLLRAWRALPRFRADAAFGTWLHRIAVNEAARLLAKEGARSHEPYEDVMRAVPDIRVDVAGEALGSELRRELSALLARLPTSYRVAVVLRDVEGFTNDEAAELLGLETRNFKSRLHRGRMILRAQLEETMGSP